VRSALAIAELKLFKGSLHPAIAASTLDPPLTRWPTFTRRVASPGISTFTLDPELDEPHALPAFHRIRPPRRLKTMRRASRPAICLKVTSMPSRSRL